MNAENEKRLDDLFKKKLEDPVDEIRYEEGDWAALEQMLNKTAKSRGIVYLLPFLGAAAAVLLVFLGWWALKPKPGTQPDKNIAHASHKTTDTIIGKNEIAGKKTPDTVMDKAQHLAGAIVKDTILEKREAIAQTKKDTIIGKTQAIAHKIVPPIKNNTPLQVPASIKKEDKNMFAQSQNVIIKKDTIFDKVVKTDKVKENMVAANQAPVTNPAAKADQPAVTPSPKATNTGLATNTPPAKGKIKPQLAYRPQYTLSVVAAPDLNGVNSFSQGKVGTNIGLTFAVGLSRKLTVTTGALYSVKPYLTSFSNYNTSVTYKWPSNPQSVTADCRMLDIPLNIGYQVYHSQQNKISVGTGLSSYIMLHESYKFTYQNQYQYGGATGPATYTVPNPGKYFFGVMNLNATYERQLNSKVGISIQPYLKVPLSNVGYSQVKLQTTGVAVGLSWNLNSLTKP